MSFSSRGRSRTYQHNARFRRGPQPSKIHPSRYVRQADGVAAATPETVTSSFADYGLDSRILKNIEQHGYVQPTPIQDQAIPVLLNGRDVVGIANTGTGKTAAFLLPLINKVLLDDRQGVLILAPTRELAVQILDELRVLINGLPVGAIPCIGGMNISVQIQRLSNNPHFVVATPGRVKDLIKRRALNMEMFTNIVLDEVDRMLDIGFRKDILFLISQLPSEYQAALFSATLDSDTERIISDFLVDPVRITVKKQETAQYIDQDIVKIQVGQNKTEVLYQLLIQEEFKKVIVFGRTKHGINLLERHLTSVGVRASAIHGNKSQNARQRSLQEFKQGKVRVLLATDIAARGIDVEDVTHVINYDEPTTYEDYIHRIGRTGRAGKSGKALTFIV